MINKKTIIIITAAAVLLIVILAAAASSKKQEREENKKNTESTAKPAESSQDEEPEFVLTTKDLGTVGENTEYPVKISLNNLGIMEFTLTCANYTDWQLAAEGFTVSRQEKSQEGSSTAEPEQNVEAVTGDETDDTSDQEVIENVEPDKDNDKTTASEDVSVNVNMTVVYSVYYGTQDERLPETDLESGEGNSVGTAQVPGTGETLEKELYLTSGQAGLRYTFKLKITDGLITDLIDSNVAEQTPTYENLDFYDEISVMIEGVKLPAGTLIVNYDVLQLEEKEDAEKMKRLILRNGSDTYKLAITNKDEYFNPKNVNKIFKAILKEKNIKEETNVKEANIGETTATLYRFGEVSTAVFTTQERNFFLFIDDDSKDYAVIEAAVKKFVEA